MKRILISAILLSVLIGGIYWYKGYINDSKFIQACRNLTGKQLTVKNLQNVSNHIYFLDESSKSAGIESIQQHHIDQYMTYLLKEEKLKIDHRVTITDNGEIMLSSGQLDGTWTCEIKADKNKYIVVTNSAYLED